MAPGVVDERLGAHHDSGFDSSILRKKRLAVDATFLAGFLSGLWYDVKRLG